MDIGRSELYQLRENNFYPNGIDRKILNKSTVYFVLYTGSADIHFAVSACHAAGHPLNFSSRHLCFCSQFIWQPYEVFFHALEILIHQLKHSRVKFCFSLSFRYLSAYHRALRSGADRNLFQTKSCFWTHCPGDIARRKFPHIVQKYPKYSGR